MLTHHCNTLGLQLTAQDFTDAEAVDLRITGGKFRLVQRLFAQIQHIRKINDLSTITREVVKAPRETLLIGTG